MGSFCSSSSLIPFERDPIGSGEKEGGTISDTRRVEDFQVRLSKIPRLRRNSCLERSLFFGTESRDPKFESRLARKVCFAINTPLISLFCAARFSRLRTTRRNRGKIFVFSSKLAPFHLKPFQGPKVQFPSKEN